MRNRSWQWRRVGWGLAASVAVASAWAAGPAADLDARYPPGSIATTAAAEKALSDAVAAQAAIDARYKAESTRCTHVFLATECQNKARRDHMTGQAQIHRVEVEAHDLQRKLAAQQRASRRDAEQAQWREQEAERARKEDEAHKAAQQRSAQAQQHAQDALRQQEQAPANREKYEQRLAQHERDEANRTGAQLRNIPENQRRYQEKQAHAKAYAATRAHERAENEKARAERERKRKAEMAEQAPQPAPAAPDPAANR